MPWHPHEHNEFFRMQNKKCRSPLTHVPQLSLDACTKVPYIMEHMSWCNHTRFTLNYYQEVGCCTRLCSVIMIMLSFFVYAAASIYRDGNASARSPPPFSASINADACRLSSLMQFIYKFDPYNDSGKQRSFASGVRSRTYVWWGKGGRHVRSYLKHRSRKGHCSLPPKRTLPPKLPLLPSYMSMLLVCIDPSISSPFLQKGFPPRQNTRIAFAFRTPPPSRAMELERPSPESFGESSTTLAVRAQT